jgi:hypothetical protein
MIMNDESDDGMVTCDGCGIVIDPGYEHMTYLVGLKEGIFLYHAGQCATRALMEADLDPGPYVRAHPVP